MVWYANLPSRFVGKRCLKQLQSSILWIAIIAILLDRLPLNTLEAICDPKLLESAFVVSTSSFIFSKNSILFLLAFQICYAIILRFSTRVLSLILDLDDARRLRSGYRISSWKY